MAPSPYVSKPIYTIKNERGIVAFLPFPLSLIGMLPIMNNSETYRRNPNQPMCQTFEFVIKLNDMHSSSNRHWYFLNFSSCNKMLTIFTTLNWSCNGENVSSERSAMMY